jgi:hypothetical protein
MGWYVRSRTGVGWHGWGRRPALYLGAAFCNLTTSHEKVKHLSCATDTGYLEQFWHGFANGAALSGCIRTWLVSWES